MEPTGQVIAAMIREEAEARLLVAEARRLGVHRNDPVIQRRLLQNMEFLGEEADGTPAGKLAAAYALNFDQSDLVVRRRMIQTMQLDAHAAARATEPTQAELEAHLAANLARFTQLPRRRISHVYFSRDARGAATKRAALQALAELRSAGAGPEGASELGDPFMFPRDLPSNSMADLAKTFGVNFAARAFRLPIGSWDGPVPSAYGEHLVFVHEEAPARVPELASIRTQVREHLLGQRSKAAERALVERLRGEYTLVIEERDEVPQAAK